MGSAAGDRLVYDQEVQSMKHRADSTKSPSAAPRRLVEKLMVDHEAHISPADPAVLLLFVLEQFIQLAKLAVVEVPSPDGYTNDIAQVSSNAS